MAVSDKTRKILWARSGNCCAICKMRLVLEQSPVDEESVVGEECHIISGKAQGPRHYPEYSAECLDEVENLLILCRVHHKLVDDQRETYTADLLRHIKTDHEKWVSEKTAESEELPRVRIRRIKENIPTHLIRMRTGRDILNLVFNAYEYAFANDELATDQEVELVASFLQEVQDYGEVYNDLGAGDKVREAQHLNHALEELETAGFWVFGAREKRLIEGGHGSPSPWPVVVIEVLRSTNPQIIKC